jgi:hypothetical protein
MSAWRRKAIEDFPHLRSLLTHADRRGRMDFSWLCAVLLQMVRESSPASDRDALARIFAYAEWCSKRHNKTLWNSVGLVFYEHLFDHREDWDIVIPFLSSGEIRANWGLWYSRPRSIVTEADLDELRVRLHYDRLCDGH